VIALLAAPSSPSTSTSGGSSSGSKSTGSGGTSGGSPSGGTPSWSPAGNLAITSGLTITGVSAGPGGAVAASGGTAAAPSAYEQAPELQVVFVWEGGQSEPVTIADATGTASEGVSFDPENSHALAFAGTYGINIWNPAQEGEVPLQEDDPDNPGPSNSGPSAASVAYSPDGREIAEANTQSDVYVLNLAR
jgi:hypothetical protein